MKVGMGTRLLAVLTADLKSIRVTELCQELGISRQTFYKYRRRFHAEGPAGLVEQSRRPHRSPNLMSAGLEDEIVRLRKELPLDRGAATIAYHLERAGWPVPSVGTIHRALVRRGLVTPQPQKRPRSSYRRFEWPRPNDAWQIDATRWVLAGGREVWIMDLLDDHSRVAVAAQACGGPTTEAAWAAFCQAAGDWGVPAHVMSDNGPCFTGRLSGGETDFERDLRALGVRHIPSSPHHPQTCGKLERFHQTLKGWLAGQSRAASPAELQAQLDTFLVFYNHHRPHRALRGATPAECWVASAPAGPGAPIPAPPRAGLRTVSSIGVIDWRGFQIGIGASLAGQRLVVIAHDDHLSIFGVGGLVRSLDLYLTRRYQPTGKPPGRPGKAKLMGPCH